MYASITWFHQIRIGRSRAAHNSASPLFRASGRSRPCTDRSIHLLPSKQHFSKPRMLRAFPPYLNSFCVNPSSQKPRVSSQSSKYIKMLRTTLLRSARLTSSSTRITRQIRARAMPSSKFYAFRTPIQAGGVRTFTVTNPQRSTIEERVKKIVAEQLGVRADEVGFPGSLCRDT